ncbi:MAG: BCCT family transporter [Aquisalimonadaceae bacterium]
MAILKWGVFKVNAPVFIISVAAIAMLLIFGAVNPEAAEATFVAARNGIAERFGWFYLLSVAGFLVFILYLCFSRYGNVKLGNNDDDPDYTYLSWFAMLFSAGMGIGLLFFSVAEPMWHYASPPMMDGETPEAARDAMRLTFYHWGMHAWAIYIVVGVSLAYFHFRRRMPLTLRSAFFPLFGERIYGPIGHVIDILAIFGTLFGIATSLGFGVMQVNGGLSYLFDSIPSSSVPLQIALVIVITGMATASLLLGLDKGIKRLSEINMVMAVSLLLFVFIVGPTVLILNTFAQTTGTYVQDLIETTFWINAFGLGDDGWLQGWTLFYWAWWISWSPFVGMFIARVSRGRTIREFVIGVLFVPVLLTFVWMSVFGTSALNLEMAGTGGILAAMNDGGSEVAMFALLENFPLAGLTSLVAILVVVLFFVTSSDSGSLVIDMLSSGGETHSHPAQRIFWASLEGLVAVILLLAGGLTALQAASIITALPFTVVMLVMCYSLHRALQSEPFKEGRMPKRYGSARPDANS